jgi:hypothetical protein
MSNNDKPPVDDSSDSLVSQERAFWREQGKALITGSIDAVDSVAKELIAVAGILEGLYFHAIAFGDLRDKTKYPPALLDQQVWWYVLPIGLLLVSLVCALAVFFPKRYQLNIHSSQASQLVFERIASRKLWWVRTSAVFLIAGVVATLITAIIYLTTRV